jgi:trimeric autotransporter adhesin
MKKKQLFISLVFAGLSFQQILFAQTNTKLGLNAGLSLTTATTNTLIGENSGQTLTTSGGNTFVGHNAGSSTTSSGNVFIGQFGGSNNTSGVYNCFMGASAGRDNTVGSNTTALGAGAGIQVSTGGNNTYLGAFAGKAPSFFTSNNCTFIGYYASTTLTSLSNATAIGANAVVNASNSIVLGDNSAATKIGIGISIPSAKLEVNSATAGVSGLKFTQLTSASVAAATNGKVLSVDANGNVVLVPDVAGAAQSNYFATAVGVGVQPNAAYMLAVCGTVRAKEVTVETGLVRLCVCQKLQPQKPARPQTIYCGQSSFA